MFFSHPFYHYRHYCRPIIKCCCHPYHQYLCILITGPMPKWCFSLGLWIWKVKIGSRNHLRMNSYRPFLKPIAYLWHTQLIVLSYCDDAHGVKSLKNFNDFVNFVNIDQVSITHISSHIRYWFCIQINNKLLLIDTILKWIHYRRL